MEEKKIVEPNCVENECTYYFWRKLMNKEKIKKENELQSHFCVSKRKMNFIFFLMFSCLMSLQLFSQNREIEALKTERPPKINGNLDDSVWQTNKKYGGFFQFDPFNSQPATENTFVQLRYDTDYLYIAIICMDREPSKIAASLTPREQFDSNDYITVVLDTFSDQRTSYSFTVNPRGVQRDQPGDYVWKSAAKITMDGWQVELKIPFKSIRFSTSKDQKWGINIIRYIFRLKETDYFTKVGRDDVFLEKCARLTGLKQIRGGKSLELFPYAGFRSSRSEDQSDQKFSVGLDVRYALTSDLNLDATISPDFSDVESDPFFYQLSPYEYQLTEKRPFFQEAGRYFPSGYDISLFYSKRIDNPIMAGKITGKQGKYTIGAVAAMNKEDGENGYIGVISLQQDILKFSKVGIMFSGYKNKDFENFNGKVNFNFKFSQKFSWDGSLQFTNNSDLPKSQNMHYKTGVFYFPDEGWNGFLEYTRIERNFKPRAGIWGETDKQNIFFRPGYCFRINKHGLKQLEFEWFANIDYTADGIPIGYNFRPLEVKLTTLKNLYFGFDTRLGRTKVQLLEDESLYWNDDYFPEKSVEFRTSYDMNRFFQCSSSIEFSETPIYNSDFNKAYKGYELECDLWLTIRPSSTLKLSVGTAYVKQSKKEDKTLMFEGAISNLGISWQITRQIFINSILQHDSYYNRMKVDLSFGIELGMGNMLSISYKSKGAMPFENAIKGAEAHTLLIKASYLLRM